MQRLVLVTRYPQPGNAKTRLIPALGPERAALVQRQLAESTVAKLRTLPDHIDLDIYFTGADLSQMRNWLGEDLHYSQQPAGSLGTILAAKAAAHLSQPLDRLIFIGADCPSLPAEDITWAFAALSNCDVVIGPALDGGYYLLGLTRFYPQLFTGIPWGSTRVFPKTFAICNSLMLNVGLLPVRRDLDRPEDLELLQGAKGPN